MTKSASMRQLKKIHETWPQQSPDFPWILCPLLAPGAYTDIPASLPGASQRLDRSSAPAKAGALLPNSLAAPARLSLPKKQPLSERCRELPCRVFERPYREPPAEPCQSPEEPPERPCPLHRPALPASDRTKWFRTPQEPVLQSSRACAFTPPLESRPPLKGFLGPGTKPTLARC